MANSIIEIPEVGMQLPEWRVALHLYVCQYRHVWRNGFSCGKRTVNKETIWQPNILLL